MTAPPCPSLTSPWQRASHLLLATACAWFGAEAWAHCLAERSSEGLNVAVLLPEPLAADFARRVRTGVTVRLVHQVHLAGESEPLSFGCEVLYDPWDEAFDVLAMPQLGKAKERYRLPTGHDELLRHLPPDCGHRAFALQPLPGTAVEVLTQLDPVSDEQVQTTRRWLAERGVGNASPSLLGRAVAALIDLKGGSSSEASCRVAAAAPAPPPAMPGAPTVKKVPRP